MNPQADIKRFYRKDGSLEREVPMLAGKLHGVEVYYREGGTVQWVNGKMVR